MRTKRQLTGRAKTRYLRALLKSSADIDAALTRADAEIAQVVVTRAAAERLATRPGTQPAPLTNAPVVALAEAATAAPPVVASAVEAPTPAAKPAPFDPYAFSAMAVLMQEGRAGLEARLALVTTREHIAQLARAQSVRLDPKLLASAKTSLPKLRATFIAAVEARVAHRKAVTG